MVDLHNPKMYAIGSADWFEAILPHTIWRIEYDLMQAQHEDEILFELHRREESELLKTSVSVGDMIAENIADELLDRQNDIVGFIVPDEFLGYFIEAYPEMTILRQNRNLSRGK